MKPLLKHLPYLQRAIEKAESHYQHFYRLYDGRREIELHDGMVYAGGRLLRVQCNIYVGRQSWAHAQHQYRIPSQTELARWLNDPAFWSQHRTKAAIAIPPEDIISRYDIAPLINRQWLALCVIATDADDDQAVATGLYLVSRGAWDACVFDEHGQQQRITGGNYAGYYEDLIGRI